MFIFYILIRIAYYKINESNFINIIKESYRDTVTDVKLDDVCRGTTCHELACYYSDIR